MEIYLGFLFGYYSAGSFCWEFQFMLEPEIRYITDLRFILTAD